MNLIEIVKTWEAMPEEERAHCRAFTSKRLRAQEAALVISVNLEYDETTYFLMYCPMLEALEKGVRRVALMPFMPSLALMQDTDYEFIRGAQVVGLRMVK